MLFEHDGGEERRLEAVRAPVTDDAAEAAQRRAAVRFVVVGQRVQVPLHGAHAACDSRSAMKRDRSLVP